MKSVRKSVQIAEPLSGKELKRALKHQAILDGAIQLFNARGIGGTNIADIAKQLGLARASLYHYVEDRSDLVFQCYQRSCDITARDLDEADRASNGLEKTFAYITAALNPERQPIAVLSEITSLTGIHQAKIRKASDESVAGVRGFIEAGIKDGSIRPCNVEIATQSIIGMLAWSQLLPHWSVNRDIKKLRKRALDSMLLLLNKGVAVEPGYIFACAERVDQFLPKLENAFDRKQATAIKADMFLARASKMFNRSGIESTSIDSVAESLGVTKGAMYHHFDDKSQLIARCYARSFDLYERFYQCSKAAGQNGLESSLTNSHLNIQAQVGSLAPLMPQPGFEAVPSKNRGTLKSRATSQNRAIASFLKLAAQEGIAVECDFGVVTHICAGAFGWIPKWLTIDQEDHGVDVADTMCDLLANGLRAA